MRHIPLNSTGVLAPVDLVPHSVPLLHCKATKAVMRIRGTMHESVAGSCMGAMQKLSFQTGEIKLNIRRQDHREKKS